MIVLKTGSFNAWCMVIFFARILSQTKRRADSGGWVGASIFLDIDGAFLTIERHSSAARLSSEHESVNIKSESSVSLENSEIICWARPKSIKCTLPS